MKDMEKLVLILCFIFLSGMIVMLSHDLNNRIDELEEKATRHRWLEERITKTQETTEQKHSLNVALADTIAQMTYNNVISYGKVSCPLGGIRLIEKYGLVFCPFCKANIDSSLAHSRWTK